MGAPGFMTWWLGTCVFLLEYALHHDPSGTLRPAVVFAFRVDFAVIMLCAGTYKASAGYRHSDGMELGMTNPWWGYAWAWWKKWPAYHPLFRTFNHMAYVVQIGAAVLMLVPWTREVGALAIAASFLGIAMLIRLGFLCEMVILAASICVAEGSAIDRLIASVMPAAEPVVAHELAFAPGLTVALSWATFVYVALLPLAKGGLYANFYGRKRLPWPLQWALERYTNLFGIIIWRVFTVEVSVKDPVTGEQRVYARPGKLDWTSRFRYLHVGEFICTASIFTTLKYHASNRALFEEKLLRYARTIPCPEGWVVHFDYVAIKKPAAGPFDFHPVAWFEVDPRSGKIEQKSLDPSFSLQAASETSPVHEGAHPGTYAPAG
jgi:hypothetical protein